LITGNLGRDASPAADQPLGGGDLSRPIKVGVVAPPTSGEVAAMEQLGTDSLWVGGHLASPNPSPEPLVWLARLAEQSHRAAIGTATLVLPWYPPAIAAKQLADIDRASKGRVILGVGAGGEYADDFNAAGVPRAERGTRLDESIDLLRRFWSAERVDHHGQHFRFEGLRIHPPPTQTGGPPIIVTGRKGPAIRRAAARGDGWMPYLYSAERYQRSAIEIRSLAATNGRDLAGFRWMLYAMVSVHDDAAVARKQAIEFVGGTYRRDPSAYIDRVTVSGTTTQVVDKLGAFAQAGVEHFVLLSCSKSGWSGKLSTLSDLIDGVRSFGTATRTA